MKKNKNHLLFLSPGLILYTVFAIVPVFYVIFLSFTDWSGLGEIHFVGLKNFITLFTDSTFAPTFFNALKNNIKYLLIVWFIITPYQYLIAFLLYIKIPGKKFIQFMVFMPFVFSTTIVAFFGMLIFNPSFGVLNSVLAALNMPTGSWFGDPAVAFKLLVFIIIWENSGPGIMILYSNFLNIPEEVREASKIDGCNTLQLFFKILFPMSLPSCASVITMSTIWALGIFDLPFILSGGSGGVNGTLDFLNMVFYRYTFGTGLNGKSDMGFGSAICIVVFVFLLAITFVLRKILSKFDYEN